MRILELALERYGAFEDRALTFGPGLTLAVGPNEAGKSTALDALADLLWGFGRANPRSFLHGSGSLSVTATVELAGQRARVRRRGGGGLVDLDTHEQWDAAWGEGGPKARRRWLEAFGLSHGVLRDGGTAVCQGHGDLSDLVFTARSGRAVRGLLESITAEADGLYKPHRGNRAVRLRAAFGDYERAAAEAVAATTTAGAVAAAQDEYERRRVESGELAGKLRASRGDVARLERYLRALSPAHDLVRLRAEQARLLAGGATLSAAQLAAFDAATGEIAEAAAARAGQEAELGERRAERAALTIDEDILADRAMIDRLARDAELRQADGGRAVEREARARDRLAAAAARLAALVGPADPRPTAALLADLHVPADLATQLDEAAAAIGELTADHRRADEELERARGALAASERAATPLDPDAAARVREVLAPIRAAGSAAAGTRAALEARSEALRHRREALRRAGALATDGEPPAAPGTTVVREERDRLVAATADLARREEDLAGAQAVLAGARDTLAAAGGEDLPDLGRLTAVRARRDELWPRVVTAWAAGVRPADREALVLRVEDALRHADEVADQIIAHADLAAKRVHLGRDVERAEAERTRALDLRDRAAEAAEAARSAWARRWSDLGVAVPAPEAADEARGAIDEAQRAQSDLLAAQARIDGLAAQVEAQRATLAAALAAAGRARPDADLDTLVEAAGILLADDDQAREARVTMANHAQRAADAEDERARRRRALDAASQRWRRVAEAAALDPALEPSGWASRRTVLDDARRGYEESVVLSAEAAQNRAAYEAFTAELSACAARHGAGPGAVADVVDRLVTALRDSATAQAKAETLDKGVAALADALDGTRRRHAAAVTTLAALAAELGLDPDPDPEAGAASALADAADRARALAEVDARLRQARERVRAASPEGDLDALVEELERFDELAVTVELADARAAADKLAGEEGEAKTAVGVAGEKLRVLRGASGAAQLHARASEHLALVAERAERYILASIQHEILRGELEAYERRHASPLLADAGRLLERLTDGRFVALRAVDRGEGQRSLLVVRADDEEMTPEMLSEGTADQVFLALRLAGIDELQRERAAAGGTTLPVVLDDVLMAFDDRRAASALAVLADLAARWQIILLTHHSHLADVATEAGIGGLDITRLPVPVLIAASRPADEIRASTTRMTTDRAGLVEPAATVARAGGIRLPAQASAPPAGADHDTTAVRRWARENGYDIGDRGRIASTILDAFHRAHNG
jgi:uncharacterized protein YhaN